LFRHTKIKFHYLKCHHDAPTVSGDCVSKSRVDFDGLSFHPAKGRVALLFTMVFVVRVKTNAGNFRVGGLDPYNATSADVVAAFPTTASDAFRSCRVDGMHITTPLCTDPRCTVPLDANRPLAYQGLNHGGSIHCKVAFRHPQPPPGLGWGGSSHVSPPFPGRGGASLHSRYSARDTHPHGQTSSAIESRSPSTGRAGERRDDTVTRTGRETAGTAGPPRSSPKPATPVGTW
jgi:hypothetical protein